MGKQLYNDIQEEIDTVVAMRDNKDPSILEDIEAMLSKSIEEYHEICNDLNIAETWVFDINDILLWEMDDKWKRDTEKYKSKTTSKEVRSKFLKYIIDLEKTKKQHSEFLQGYITHLRKTYNNWKKNLFTCYDVIRLPNDNLDLELYHSKLKRKHRRMTWKKSSQQYLLLHWTQATQCLDLEYSIQELSQLLASTDYQKVINEHQKEYEKSKKRGRHMKARKDLNNTLEGLKNDWFNVS